MSLSKKAKAGYVLLAFLTGIAVGCLYRLTWEWMLALGVIFCIFVPFLLRNHEKRKTNTKCLHEAQIYMEQLLYAFLHHEKLLTSIEEVAVLFPTGRMHERLEQAIHHIRFGYKEEKLAEGALELIEDGYQNNRLKTIHRFLLQVEKIGGEAEGILALLLEDLNHWKVRIDLFQKEYHNQRRNIQLAFLVSSLVCVVTIYLLPQEVDITHNIIRMSSTIIFFFIQLFLYLRADNKLARDWLKDEVEEKSDLRKKYDSFLDYQEKREARKSLLWAILPACITIGCVIGKSVAGTIFFGCITAICAFQHKIGHSLARKALTREIEKAFPRWLMELSLQLQLNNVQVAIYKTLENAPEVLQSALENFQKEITAHPESAEPYLMFLSDFDMPQIHATMKMLYSISIGSGGSEKQQLEEMIQRNQNLLDQAEEMQFEDSLAGMYALFLAPALVGGLKLLVDMSVFMVAFFTQIRV